MIGKANLNRICHLDMLLVFYREGFIRNADDDCSFPLVVLVQNWNELWSLWHLCRCQDLWQIQHPADARVIFENRMSGCIGWGADLNKWRRKDL
ncbi:hypothetical protein RC55_17525 [Herbaspirillum seropedicae]|nr:hypothetical protein [Herbaspirillum seropedicae]